jgi:hypothetical protein
MERGIITPAFMIYVYDSLIRACAIVCDYLLMLLHELELSTTSLKRRLFAYDKVVKPIVRRFDQ